MGDATDGVDFPAGFRRRKVLPLLVAIVDWHMVSKGVLSKLLDC